MTGFLYQLTTYSNIQTVKTYTCNIYIINVFEWECYYSISDVGYQNVLDVVYVFYESLRKQFWIGSASMAVEISGVLENLQNQYSYKNSYFISDVSECIGCICVLYSWIIRKAVFYRHCKHGGRHQRFPIKSAKPIYLQKKVSRI